MINVSELYHHGVRKYQFADGTRTPAGIQRYYANKSSGQFARTAALSKMKVKDLTNMARTQITGKQYADTYLKKGTTFSRIQTSKEFENFAFYATYKKQDSDKYMGLFGKNLTSRANAAAKQAEKQAHVSGSESDLANAKELRSISDNMKVYQLKISSTKKLKVPSDENAGHITANLLKEKDFKSNVVASIADSKSKMKRPAQQILFKQAENALKKDPSVMTKGEKIAVYKALNLSLTNHNAQEIATQDRFYSELKKKVKLQSVSQTNPKVVDKMYRKYNSERIAKESIASTIGVLGKMGNKTVSECNAYVRRKTADYLS